MPLSFTVLHFEREPAIEAIIQKQWDRRLEAQPVLVLLIGFDVAMMAALSDYGVQGRAGQRSRVRGAALVGGGAACPW